MLVGEQSKIKADELKSRWTDNWYKFETDMAATDTVVHKIDKCAVLISKRWFRWNMHTPAVRPCTAPDFMYTRVFSSRYTSNTQVIARYGGSAAGGFDENQVSFVVNVISIACELVEVLQEIVLLVLTQFVKGDYLASWVDKEKRVS